MICTFLGWKIQNNFAKKKASVLAAFSHHFFSRRKVKKFVTERDFNQRISTSEAKCKTLSHQAPTMNILEVIETSGERHKSAP